MFHLDVTAGLHRGESSREETSGGIPSSGTRSCRARKGFVAFRSGREIAQVREADRAAAYGLVGQPHAPTLARLVHAELVVEP